MINQFGSEVYTEDSELVKNGEIGVINLRDVVRGSKNKYRKGPITNLFLRARKKSYFYKKTNEEVAQ